MEKIDNNYYMVRAMEQTERDFSVFFNNDVVAVGWSKVDFTSFNDLETLVEEVKKIYYSDNKTAPQVIGKKINEVLRFKNIKKGDKIIIPYYDSVCLAEALEEEIYDISIKNSSDLSNQRKVNYKRNENNNIISVPRSELSEGLKRRLGVRGTTISDLYEFSEEIEGIFKTNKDYSWLININEKQKEKVRKFKKQLLENIQFGKTYLQSGGIGLEYLVKELLEVEGYNAKVLPKKTFTGFADADVRATKTDRFEEIKLLIQVKHHAGESDTWGAEQLRNILNENPNLEDKLVLITSAKASEELIDVCKKNNISLLIGIELVDWIFDLIPKLSSKTKRKLGISDIPELIL